MNRKTATTAAALLLLAGVAAIAVPALTKDRNAPSPASASASASAPATTGDTTTGADAGGATTTRAKAKNAATARLSEKYGDSRTKLAGHITTELMGMADDLLVIMDLAEKSSLGEAMFNDPFEALGVVKDSITLTDEQKTKITELQAASTKRQADEARKTVGDLKRQPELLMEALLLSDAFKRGEITHEEFDSAIKALSLPEDAMDLTFDRHGNDNAEDDPIFVAELLRVLDEAQAAAYKEALAAHKEAKAQEAPTAEKEVKTLEEYDKEISSTRKILSGAVQLMEGISDGGIDISVDKK